MQEEQIREALNTHWQASAAGDANAEHDIYDDDAICDYARHKPDVTAVSVGAWRKTMQGFPEV